MWARKAKKPDAWEHLALVWLEEMGRAALSPADGDAWWHACVSRAWIAPQQRLQGLRVSGEKELLNLPTLEESCPQGAAPRMGHPKLVGGAVPCGHLFDASDAADVNQTNGPSIRL